MRSIRIPSGASPDRRRARRDGRTDRQIPWPVRVAVALGGSELDRCDGWPPSRPRIL